MNTASFKMQYAQPQTTVSEVFSEGFFAISVQLMEYGVEVDELVNKSPEDVCLDFNED